MKKLIVANWKMNPIHEKDAEVLIREFSELKIPQNVEAVICPPTPYLCMAKKTIKNMVLGAQDAQWEDGEVTGEVTPETLRDFNVEYVIVGHSERREKLHETNEDVWRKAAAVEREGMYPILCVGEPWSVRREGFEAAVRFVLEELERSTASLISFPLTAGKGAVAYEPVWSISTSGSGKQDSPEDAVQMIERIRGFLAERNRPDMRVLYGGTVNRNTASAFLSEPGIDGVLVGHASLDAKEFQEILNAAGE